MQQLKDKKIRYDKFLRILMHFVKKLSLNKRKTNVSQDLALFQSVNEIERAL